MSDLLATANLQPVGNTYTSFDDIIRTSETAFMYRRFAEDSELFYRMWELLNDYDEEPTPTGKVLSLLDGQIEQYKEEGNNVSTIRYPSAKGTRTNRYYASDDFYVKIMEGPTYRSFSFNLKKGFTLFDDVMKQLETEARASRLVNDFCVLIKNKDGEIKTKTLKSSTSPFIEMNYVPEVLEGYNNLVYELQAKKPNGRLSILEGPPGTGKTHILKDLPLAVPTALFILVPPALVRHVGDPEMVEGLLRVKQEQEEEGKALVLILEDADDCLQKRDGSNTSLVSALLNATSGILGDSLNLRIVATSNLEKAKIDEAILRPGRLGTYIAVSDLDEETATNVYRRLVEDDEADYACGLHGTSLAEVYGAAAGSGRMNIRFNKKKTNGRAIGFQADV